LLPGYQSNRLTNPRRIFEFLPKAVIVTDESGQPVSYNQTAADLLGKIPPKIRPEEWPRQFGFYLPDGKTQYPGESFPILRALNGENVENEEVFLMDGQYTEGKWITISSVPLISHKGIIDGHWFFSVISLIKAAEMQHENRLYSQNHHVLCLNRLPRLVMSRCK
jgi:PAS domain-containing protein